MTKNRRISDFISPVMAVDQSCSQSFLKSSNVSEIARGLTPYRTRAGESIIQENAPAEFYGIIAAGSADVYHSEDGETVCHVASLEAGDTFGEEGLIIGNHTHTVTMKDNGVIFKVSKESFVDNLYTPLLSEVTQHVARVLQIDGWEFLDIRYEFEIEIFGTIEGSLHIPLHSLRRRVGELDKCKKYVVFCKSGNRSKAATILLSQNGINACSLSGGFTDWV